MSDQKKAPKSKYTVTSAFIWDGGIKKPKDTVELTKTEAHGLIKRGKIEEPKRGRGKQAEASDD
ncbi:hypothetical protein [Leisingera sp. ANG-M7]|uniref:hypothetical protein n=1 Tax=Leisingera sp. ANG-M7 TaxID=1577902 RepID=UPI00057E1F1D|nr:hypothetical protein [Leisingera sp. ANG-M7]KIC36548.1 hypothetical protein RA26_12520 [Leisingera sp. ANG-M7]